MRTNAMNDNRKTFTLSPVGTSARWFFAVMTLFPILVDGVRPQQRAAPDEAIVEAADLRASTKVFNSRK